MNQTPTSRSSEATPSTGLTWSSQALAPHLPVWSCSSSYGCTQHTSANPMNSSSLSSRWCTCSVTPSDKPHRIMRICLLIPLYSVFAFMSICFPNGFVYLTPWLDVFQSIALGSFFLLLCEFILPSYHQRDVFFAALKVPHGKKHEKSGPISGLTWYRVRMARRATFKRLTFFCREGGSPFSNTRSLLWWQRLPRASHKRPTFTASRVANHTLLICG